MSWHFFVRYCAQITLQKAPAMIFDCFTAFVPRFTQHFEPCEVACGEIKMLIERMRLKAFAELS